MLVARAANGIFFTRLALAWRSLPLLQRSLSVLLVYRRAFLLEERDWEFFVAGAGLLVLSHESLELLVVLMVLESSGTVPVVVLG